MKTFKEQADELINYYNIVCHGKTIIEKQIKTLIQAGEYYGSFQMSYELRSENIDSIKKLKEAIKCK